MIFISKKFAISLVIGGLAIPVIGNAYECKHFKDEVKGLEHISVSTEIAFANKTLAQTRIDYQNTGENINYYLIGMFVFEDWKFLGDEVYDIDQTKFEKVILKRDTLGGKLLEAVQISVEKSYLEAHSSTGMKFTIYGSKGNADMSFDAAMISDFLSCLPANQ